MKFISFSMVLFLCTTVYAQEQNHEAHTNHESYTNHDHHQMSNEWSSYRPDGHAPISIMGDHLHHKGGWMFTYRYMKMNMKNLQQNGDEISNMKAHMGGYMATPLEMNMDMHMLGAMYAPSNNVTLMIMTNYLTNNMDLQMLNMSTDMIMPFSTSSSGFGDLKISGLFKVFNKKKQAMHARAGLSIPTGSIDHKDVTPMSMENQVILPYPMQTGSGTFDAEVGITYLGQNDMISWGSQINGTVRMSTNNNDYKLGNAFNFNNWLAIKATESISFSTRLELDHINQIKGENPELNPMMVTTADTDNSGGTQLNLGLGFNTYIPDGKLKDFRFSFEYELPLYQSLNGIQLETKSVFVFGLQYAFH